jgi:hypothetical protein
MYITTYHKSTFALPAGSLVTQHANGIFPAIVVFVTCENGKIFGKTFLNIKYAF